MLFTIFSVAEVFKVELKRGKGPEIKQSEVCNCVLRKNLKLKSRQHFIKLLKNQILPIYKKHEFLKQIVLR